MSDESLNCSKSTARSPFDSQVKTTPVMPGSPPAAGRPSCADLNNPQSLNFRTIRGGVYLSGNDATTSTCRCEHVATHTPP